MANGFVPKAPKRFVQRVNSRLSQILSNSEGGKVLHTTGERETLVRTIITLEMESITAQSFGSFGLEIVIEPSGVQTRTAATSESLDQDLPSEVLWMYNGEFPAVEMVTQIEVDLKSMRKLMPGDEIVLRTIAANASSIGLSGNITQFFKLA